MNVFFKRFALPFVLGYLIAPFMLWFAVDFNTGGKGGVELRYRLFPFKRHYVANNTAFFGYYSANASRQSPQDYFVDEITFFNSRQRNDFTPGKDILAAGQMIVSLDRGGMIDPSTRGQIAKRFFSTLNESGPTGVLEYAWGLVKSSHQTNDVEVSHSESKPN